MRPIRSLLIYAGFVFSGGGLLAPWLYWGVQWLATVLPPFEKLAEQPFHRYVNRALLGLALIGLWPLLRSLGARSLGDAGLVKPNGQWRRLFGGFALGFVSLACAAAGALAAGAREVNTDLSAGRLTGKVLGAALAAAVASVLEEVLFRGAIFGALRKACRWPVALVISGAIYASVHFFAKPQSPARIDWSSGLALLPGMLRGPGEIEQVVPGFFSLTLAGALLALAYQRTGNLYCSIGLHAGWIFWLKSYGFLTRETIGLQARFWGTGKLIDGWVALAILLIALCVLARLLPVEHIPESPG